MPCGRPLMYAFGAGEPRAGDAALGVAPGPALPGRMNWFVIAGVATP